LRFFATACNNSGLEAYFALTKVSVGSSLNTSPCSLRSSKGHKSDAKLRICCTETPSADAYSRSGTGGGRIARPVTKAFTSFCDAPLMPASRSAFSILWPIKSSNSIDRLALDAISSLLSPLQKCSSTRAFPRDRDCATRTSADVTSSSLLDKNRSVSATENGASGSFSIDASTAGIRCVLLEATILQPAMGLTSKASIKMDGKACSLRSVAMS